MTSILKNGFQIGKTNSYANNLSSTVANQYDVYDGIVIEREGGNCSPTSGNNSYGLNVHKQTLNNSSAIIANNKNSIGIDSKILKNVNANFNVKAKRNEILTSVNILPQNDVEHNNNDKKEPKIQKIDFEKEKIICAAKLPNVESAPILESLPPTSPSAFVAGKTTKSVLETSCARLAIQNECKFNEAPFEQHYDVGERLGSGQFALVFRVTKRSNGELYAAKFIRKRRYATSRRGVPRSHIQREVEVLRTVSGHDNIIELHEVFETSNDIILVLELVSGGELFDHVCAKEFLHEAEASAFIRQILCGVQHLHANHVVHLDLKPENIILKKRNESAIKLVDFGLSRKIMPGTIVKDMIGTPEFVAPEIVNYEALSSATDMWSLGIVTYILLSGGSPFIGRTREETFCNISGVKYHFSHNYFGNTSAEAKDFIARLLVREPRRRPNARECLEHPWIKKYYHDRKFSLNSSIMQISNENLAKIQRRWQRAMKCIRFCNQIIRSALNNEKRKKIIVEIRPREAHKSMARSKGTVRTLSSFLQKIISPEVGCAARTALADRKKKKQEHLAKMHEARRTVPTAFVDSVPSISSSNQASTSGVISTKDNVVASAVFVACEENNVTALEQLSNTYSIDILNIENELGETPLHVASGAGCELAAAFLLRRGADARHVDKNGDTPLAWAARNGHAHLVRLLLTGYTSGLASYGGRKSPLKTKISHAEKVFTATSDVNAVNEAGETALHIATRYTQVECALALLENGANSDIQDEHGETALHIASWHGDALLLGILCRFDPNQELVNMDDETALHCASTRGHIECVQNLVENGTPIDLPDACGQTPLHLALKRSYVDVAHFLIAKGCDINAQDQDGDTPLHIASRLGLVSVAEALCHLRANLDVQNSQSLTPLHIAARECRAEVVRCLCLAGCNCNIKTKDGLTAEIISFAHKNSEIGSLLAKMKSEQARDQYVQQLSHLPTPLRRIKLKFFGHSCVGKSALIHALQQTPSTSGGYHHHHHGAAYTGASSTLSNTSGGGGSATMRPLNSIVEAVSRRLSDNLLMNSVHAHWNNNGISQSHPAISNRSNHSVHAPCSPSSSANGSSKRVADENHPMGFGGACTSSNSSCYTSTICSTASSASADSGVDSDATYGRASSKECRSIESYPLNYEHAIHANYTCGIDVQNVYFPACGEFSIWEFGGYEPYHIAYDHFVGNTDCIHIVVIRATDPTEVQYKQVLYWMNFLKGRVTPSEPIGHCGVVWRRSKVVVIGTCATPELFGVSSSSPDELLSNSDADAMMKTVKLRFETHFDIHERIIFLDSRHVNCSGMHALRAYLQESRDAIVDRLQRPLLLLDICVAFLAQLRKRYANFPMITWPHFTNVIRNEINPLATDPHCRQLVQQLQLVGELVYLRDETLQMDYVVLTPEWLGTHVLGRILSAHFLERCPSNGCYSVADFAGIFPEIVEASDLLRILDTLQLCTLIDDPTTAAVAADAGSYEFPAFISAVAPTDAWAPPRVGAPSMVYGGMRIVPQRGMEKSLQSTFPRIQVSMRRSMRDFQDPMDAELVQWRGASKMCSGQMQAYVRLVGDAVEVQVRGPMETASSCIYFLEDVANLVEQTAAEVAPGICIERHFLSPRHLREHRAHPASFPPEVIMAMQQRESIEIRNTDGEVELFTDVVCFGSKESAAALTLGVDVSVSQLPLASRCELAALLDPPDSMGRDWSILAVKLNLTDQVPEVDSTGQSLSRTDQLLAEWALQCPEQASIGRLCAILEELGREDARDVLYRTMPLYLFGPQEDNAPPSSQQLPLKMTPSELSSDGPDTD